MSASEREETLIYRQVRRKRGNPHRQRERARDYPKRTESLKDNIPERPRRSSTPDVVDSVAAPRLFNGVIPPPTPMRRSTSCGDEMMTRRTASRDTGRSYLIRERKESDSLLANLMNLRNILLSSSQQQGQQV